jgi:flagellum-specific peptidoglycan hydrolase FlgJ
VDCAALLFAQKHIERGNKVAQMQQEFLEKAYQSACSAGHIFPEIAACEAALESAWGQSKLAREANNLFGQKQSHPPLAGSGTLTLPTQEFLHNQWVNVEANWVRFASWQDCFQARMALLKRLSRAYPHYAAALAAQSGEDFAAQVSKSWSTDPGRAAKVLAVHALHRASFVALRDVA